MSAIEERIAWALINNTRKIVVVKPTKDEVFNVCERASMSWEEAEQLGYRCIQVRLSKVGMWQ